MLSCCKKHMVELLSGTATSGLAHRTSCSKSPERKEDFVAKATRLASGELDLLDSLCESGQATAAQILKDG